MSDLQKQLGRFVDGAKWRQHIPAKMGRITAGGGFEFEVNGKPTYTWVRLQDGTNAEIAARNHRLAHVANLPVLVQRNFYDEYEIIDIADGFEAFYGGERLYNTNASPYGSGSTTTTGEGLVKVSSGLVVSVGAFPYQWDTEDRYYVGETLNLADYVPTNANTHAWVKIGVSPVSNAAVAVQGTVKSQALNLNKTELAAIPFGNYIPLAGVKLRYGQTTISSSDIITARPWWTGAQATGQVPKTIASGRLYYVATDHQAIWIGTLNVQGKLILDGEAVILG